MISAALADEIEEKMRPVGQVVKTEASHAFNIGSNPVRVTSSERAEVREDIDKARRQVYNDCCSGESRVTIVGAD